MKTKRILSLLITALIFLTSLCACNLDFLSTSSEANDSSYESNNSSLASDGSISSESSNTDSSVDVNESSQESETPKDSVVSFLACPDNIIHPSVFYNAIEVAARNDGVTPDYSDLHNAKYDFAPIYKNVADAIKNADVAYINQETLVGVQAEKYTAIPASTLPKQLPTL